MEAITALLHRISTIVPVDWDRYVETPFTFEIKCYAVYGWIQRKDGKRDFVLLYIYVTGLVISQVYYITSSAKYSKELCKVINGEEAIHTDCKLVSELPSFTANNNSGR